MFDLGRSFVATVERSPRALAIIDGERRLTYAEWYSEVCRVVDGLAAQGLRKGDHLAVVLQNRLAMASVYWACQLAGFVVTLLNWRMKAEELDYCLTDAEARAVIFEGVSDAAVGGSRAAQQIPRIAVGCAEGGTCDFETSADVGRQHIPQAGPEDFSLLFYTSGTTGRPKGVPRRHRAERAAALAHIAQNLYQIGERTLGAMPLYHTMGVRSLLAMALVDGVFICLPRFEGKEALRLIAREQVTNLDLVPTLYHDLLAVADFSPEKVHSVKKLGFAGAAMPEGLLKRLEAAFRPELFVNHYGSSEIYTFTIDQHAAKKPGSAGKAGINQRIRVIRLGAETADVLAGVGEEGEVVADLSGDEAFEGYWRRPDADTRALRDGWYLTGDTGYLDEAGDLFVTGRVDDMIISGGENISPGEIESVLSLHPAIGEVAVAGLPDERLGQRVVAFIRRAAAIDAAVLDSWCRASPLADYKRPRAYVFVAEIPKSPVGKVLRRKLVAGEYESDAQ
ncbi:MAG: AMP-binding protein [Alphaproteobacteria bacterium]|nr:AMP-binding protein [Alphaproteobacteria bacterium]